MSHRLTRCLPVFTLALSLSLAFTLSLTLTLTLTLASSARAERIVVAEPEAGAIERHLRYRFEATNTTAEPVAGAHLLVYVPVRGTATQRLLWVDASHDARLDSDALGNTWATLTLPFLPPRGTALVSLTAAVAVTSDARALPPGDDPALLSAEPYIESNDPLITAFTRSLARSTPLVGARAVYDIVRVNVRPEAFEPQDLGAVHALSSGQGDCTDMAYAFIALARAAGLRARLAGGWVSEASALLRPERYHNWAEFHDGTTWRVVDPHSGSFGGSADYIATHLGGPWSEGPLRGFHRFRADHPAVTLRMLGAPAAPASWRIR